MKFKKSFAILLMAAVTAAVLGGCGDSQKSVSTNKSVTLKYLMSGPGVQEDSEKVWKAFNEKLHEKLPNVTVEFDVIPISEFKQQFLLMQASREKIDITNTYTLSFSDEVKNASFAQIDDLLDKYGKDVKKVLPEWLFDYMKVNGKLYGIPSYQMLATVYGLKTQKEYGDEYLDIDKMKKALYSSETMSDEAYVVMEEYLKKLKENGKLFLGVNHWLYGKGVDSIASNYAVDIDDESCKVFYQFQSEKSKKNYARLADWYKKGYIRKDSLSATDISAKIGLMNGYTLWSAPITPWTDKIEKDKYGIDVLTIPYSDKYYIPRSNGAAGTAIMEASKHKEEAMKLLNLLQSDKELYNLLVFGIEGEHYTKISDDRIETVSKGQATSNDKYGLWKWIIGNTALAYDTQAEGEGYKKWVFEEVNCSKFRSPLIGFVPDVSKISNQIAQVDAIKGEYMNTLASGSNPNWEQLHNEWMDKIEKAGNSEVITELQTQIDAFLEAKK